VLRHRPVSVSTTTVALALILSACVQAGGPRAARGPGPHPEGSIEEAQEQAERTDLRLDALKQARAEGTLGVTGRITKAPAAGWIGESILNVSGDDWEPAIATDPSSRFVYVMHNRYGVSPCKGPCPDPAMIVHVSRDGGKTWRREHYLCECRRVGGQYDPLLEVVPDTGEVYAVWMNDYDIQFAKSGDHGRTWTDPTFVHGESRWGDKPNFATSADGQDVYVLFNGPSDGDVWAAVSHDAGTTWTSARVTSDERYHFAYGTAVLPGGRVVSSQISFTYSGKANSAEGIVRIHVYTSDDDGVTWTDSVVDELELGIPCSSAGCYADFYDSGPALAADAGDGLVIVYSGASEPGGPRTVYARSSTDGGLTWSDRTRLSPVDANAAFAAAAGRGNGDVRIYYADQRTGRWNVWYRASKDLGQSWTKAVRISDATSGTAYKNAKGFLQFYGDYGEMAITGSGKTVAVWGEGASYAGPGGVWFNLKR